MSHEGDKTMCNDSQWPEDKADWPQTASVVQGGVVSAKPAQSYGKTRQVTVEQLVKLQERCDELLKQRDELLAALEQFVTWGRMRRRAQSKGCHTTFDMMSLKDEIDLAEAVIDSVEGW